MQHQWQVAYLIFTKTLLNVCWRLKIMLCFKKVGTGSCLRLCCFSSSLNNTLSFLNWGDRLQLLNSSGSPGHLDTFTIKSCCCYMQNVCMKMKWNFSISTFDMLLELFSIKYWVWKLSHSVSIYILDSIAIFLETGLYNGSRKSPLPFKKAVFLLYIKN